MKTIYWIIMVLGIFVVAAPDMRAQSPGTRINLCASKLNGKVELKCSAENINPPVSIERSFDGENWTAIGSSSDRGSANYFLFTDSTPVMGLSFYRVTDNSSSEKSNTVSLVMDNNFYKVTPNVLNEKMSICSRETGAKDVTIQIVGLDGQLQQEIKTRLTNIPFELDFSAIKKGTYIIRIQDEKKTYAYKLFVIKEDLEKKINKILNQRTQI